MLNNDDKCPACGAQAWHPGRDFCVLCQTFVDVEPDASRVCLVCEYIDNGLGGRLICETCQKAMRDGLVEYD